jgi:hypothetical protein
VPDVQIDSAFSPFSGFRCGAQYLGDEPRLERGPRLAKELKEGGGRF